MGLFSNKPEITAVIPAYNEENAVIPTINGLREALQASGLKFEIITVDDGSSDGTAAAAEAAGSRVIRHPVNRGYGRALISGIEAAAHEWILIIDADGSYPPAEAGKILKHIPAYDLVIGARQGKLFWGSYVKAFMRWTYLSLARFVAGEHIPDANSGLRVFRKSALADIPVLCFGYSFTTTMTLSFLSAGKFVRFEPTEFTDRVGSSKVKPVRDILRTLQIMTQVIIYYNPLKFAAVLALVPPVMLLAGLLLPYYLHAAWLMLVMSVSAGLVIFLLGCTVESIRLRRRK